MDELEGMSGFMPGYESEAIHVDEMAVQETVIVNIGVVTIAVKTSEGVVEIAPGGRAAFTSTRGDKNSPSTFRISGQPQGG